MIKKIQTQTISWDFPYVALFNFIIFLGVYIFYSDDIYILNKTNIFKYLISIIGCFSLLEITSLLLNIICLKINCIDENINLFSKPTTFLEQFYCILNFIFASFYEEILYRFYLPQIMLSIFDKFKTSEKREKIIKITIEIIIALIFAFSHLYMGIFPVINAFIAHFILRYFYVKSKNILCSFIPHCIYNIVSMILL